MHHFSGPELLKRLRLAATSIGPDVLGLTADQNGLHWARSGAAMATNLAGVPVFTIMLLGHWLSNAFLRYIRKKVKELSKGISNKMIQNENFFMITEHTLGGCNLQDSGHHLQKQTSFSDNGLSFKGTIVPLAHLFRQA